MLEVIASARPEFDPALQTLTFAIPDVARHGDVMIAVVVYVNASSIVVPDGWIDLGTSAAGGIKARRLCRMFDAREPVQVAIDTTSSGDEIQGSLVVLRGAGSTALLVETSATLTFAATMAPGSPALSVLQAIDLVLEVWSSSGALVMTPPAGSDPVDTYSTALVTPRTLLVAKRRANATGALTLGAAASGSNATGTSFALALRDGLPMQPIELVDLVPGNIGLLGIDRRPPREAA